ncbi:MAG: glutamine synthetase family protein [Balneola sp.]
MNKEEIITLIKEHPARSVKFAVTDIDGVLRGKLLSKDKVLKSIEDDKIGFCNVIFGWDINDACYDNTEKSGWHIGYPDASATIDIDTCRSIPWEDEKLFFLGDFEQSERLTSVCPRSLLKKVKKQADEMGYTPKFSNEFEWFNFNETPQSFCEKGYVNPTPLTPGMFGYSILRTSQYSGYVNDLFELLHQFDIPVEGLHTETGDGVYEACIKYDDILKAADQAVLFKNSVKEIAFHHEIMPSFMAKWNKDLPGCSAHVHQSLWDKKESRNLFFDGKAKKGISEIMESYIAGQLHCLPFILPVFAPTVNSYKRFVDGSWAPTTSSWGIENRTTALRVINHDESSMRLENRVPGADTNAYLIMAASLASGLYGIKNKLKLEKEETIGNEYENIKSDLFPTNLHKATKAMKESDIAEELFGKEFVDHFIKTREWEWRQYDPKQKNWELKRYFEIV